MPAVVQLVLDRQHGTDKKYNGKRPSACALAQERVVLLDKQHCLICKGTIKITCVISQCFCKIVYMLLQNIIYIFREN